MSRSIAKVSALALCFLTMIINTEAYYLVIDAHAEECFFERVTSGTKLGLTFEVVEGGFLDIDVTITGKILSFVHVYGQLIIKHCFSCLGPDQKIIHQEERASSGKYTFGAHMDGDYNYCFGNKMSTMTPKVMMFSMDIEKNNKQDPKDSASGDSAHDKLEEKVKELSTGLISVKHEQEYMAVRDRIHRQINDNTNSRVMLWAVFEALLLIAMTLGQIFYLKRFFEVRRAV